MKTHPQTSDEDFLAACLRIPRYVVQSPSKRWVFPVAIKVMSYTSPWSGAIYFDSASRVWVDENPLAEALRLRYPRSLEDPKRPSYIWMSTPLRVFMHEHDFELASLAFGMTEPST